MKDRPRVINNIFGVLEGILTRLNRIETTMGNRTAFVVTPTAPVLTATTLNPNLGTGGVAGIELRDDGWISGNGLIQFGTSGVSAGNGTYRISLPNEPAAIFAGSRRIVGRGLAWHSGNIVDLFKLMWTPSMGATCEIWSAKSAGNPTYTSSNPWTWVAGDYILYNLHYPR